MDMDLNNRLTEDETLEQAYDIFLELAADNLDPADVLLFNLQFEERGGAELFDAPRDKCTLSCAINGIHAAFHYLKKNYISGCVMTVSTG
ncbi:DUF440 family protein [Escherichia coli]|nr:DUF440 family protein [Escherichia coli]EFB1836681.1 DUF440 family protein [Escherichia coli]EFB1840331.1 DUF440 family protein [Escherichia coli]EFK8400664.1 DUF440 family protein [Escherichia coli]